METDLPSAATSPISGSIGIISSFKDTIVSHVDVEGFGTGIHLAGKGSQVSHTKVTDCLVGGVSVGGGNGTIHHTAVGDIGGAKDYHGVTFGMVMRGDNNVVSYSNVHDIRGTLESCGYMFGGSAKLHDSIAQGQGSTGWSFGVWGGGSGGVTISKSYLHSWDEAIGNRGVITVLNSTLQGYHQAALGGFIDGGNVRATSPAPNNARYIAGTTGRDHIVGGDGDNFIVGRGGADTLFGGKGDDIFACSANSLSLLPDFTPGEDRISTTYYKHNNSLQIGETAKGRSGTMLFDPDTHILSYDRDGAGRTPAQKIAYMPYVFSLDHSDFYWV